MENLIVELEQAAGRCEKTTAVLQRRPLKQMSEALFRAITQVGKASTDSWIADQGTIYIENFGARQADELFDTEWGTPDGRWRIYTYEQVLAEIVRRADNADLDRIVAATNLAGKAFHSACDEVLPAFEALLAHHHDDMIFSLRREIKELRSHILPWELLRDWQPWSIKDDGQGIRVPHHVRFKAWLSSELSYAEQAEALGRMIRRGSTYLRHSLHLNGWPNDGNGTMATGRRVSKSDDTIFIGHGRSSIWLQLREHLKERLGLTPDEFNEECTVGRHPRQRLEVMLDRACFAFLVMTGEDEFADGELHARANVIHEAGLFQGRLGFDRVALLVEEGCSSFSNVEGLTEIRFRKGKIRDTFQEVRDVLEREGILQPAY